MNATVPRTWSSPQGGPSINPQCCLSVLVVDDSPVIRDCISGLLQARDHRVSLASNGFEAIRACRDRQFDVILLDLEMPEMGGVEALRMLRVLARRVGAQTRIVVCTASPLGKQQCLRAAVDGVLTKPVTPQALYRAVEGRVARKYAESGPIAVAKAADSYPLQARLEEYFAGSHEVFAAMAGSLLRSWPALRTELEEGTQLRDAGAIRRAAHRLRGSVGQFDTGHAFAVAGALDQLSQDAPWSVRLKLVEALIAGVDDLTRQLASALGDLAERSEAG